MAAAGEEAALETKLPSPDGRPMRWEGGRLVPMRPVNPFEDSDAEEAPSAPAEPYYWEREDEGVDVPTLTRLWHTTHWVGAKVLEGVDFAGEVLADLFGLNQSKFQWVIDAKEREDQEREDRRVRIARRRARDEAEAQKGAADRAAALEAGDGAGVGGDI